MSVITGPGPVVRHYRILERLGSGGMGVVYKADDTKLGRTTALKFLPPELTRDDNAKQRFLVEAQAAARLDHPNICTVYEVGESEEGQLYIAMAYYEGETLDRRIARGAIPVAEAVGLARQVARGLDHAHAAGIVHRDVKPGNIIVTTSGTAKILDFGLAKLVDLSITHSRTAVGTAAYMAPEQVSGGKVTPATDVWGLGVLLYEALAGKRPFEGEYEQSVLYAVLNDVPPLVRESRPDIPLQLDAVVQKMLMKDPSQRQRSMTEVDADLAAALLTESEPQVEKEARFTPGSIVSGRYRIVSLLGEGGMGAVYRADDLKLGQKVALKYIPQRLTSDAVAFERICNEVRVGRQLSHPNVCRVFDIVEAGGHRFIAMEYIDGEDLASLLRRIGKLPHDKALAVTRDIAAGLAAAHDRGIVHRDLKPANVMIDGEGRARITDFGLAAAAADLTGTRDFAGTPAYMAPEQLARGEATARSDLFALGLIMFEMFRGRRMYDGTTVDEIRGQHSRRSVSSSRDLDPEVERIILRCIENDPSLRFASVHAFIAALPGVDALTAAIAAGETPSPAMVAAASTVGDLSPARAWTLLLALAVILLATAWLADRATLGGLTPNISSHDALAARAREVTATFGHAAPRFVRYVAYVENGAYIRWVGRKDHGKWDRFRSAPPSPFRCIFRTSPIRFAPLGTPPGISPIDPPETIAGMATLHFDHEGRLVLYQRVPESLPSGGPIDWSAVFDEADLDVRRFSPAAPQWTPPYGYDTRHAWTGTHAASSVPLRVEAATLRGRVVWLRVIEPWDTPARATSLRFFAGDGIAIFAGIAIFFLAILARRNIVHGRSDVRGATRVALVVFALAFAASTSIAVPVVMPRWIMNLTWRLLGTSTYMALAVWVSYVAIEPYVRRRWPRILISWSRLLRGQFSDAMIGRDILVGLPIGASFTALWCIGMLLVNASGRAVVSPANILAVGSLDTSLGFVAAIADPVVSALTWAMPWLGMLVLLRLPLRNDLAALLGLAAVLSLVGMLNPSLPGKAVGLLFAFVSAWCLYRYGIIALTSLIFAFRATSATPMTLSFDNWFAIRSTMVILVIFAIGAWAFYLALAGKPVFGRALSEEG